MKVMGKRLHSFRSPYRARAQLLFFLGSAGVVLEGAEPPRQASEGEPLSANEPFANVF